MPSNRLILEPPSGVHRVRYRFGTYPGAGTNYDRRYDRKSVRAIQTSKSINDLAGTFTITLKDSDARRYVREMDACWIRMHGHYSDDARTVLRGVVDEVRAATSSDPYAASNDTIITGRCAAKWLMVASMFLPVWDPQAALPTALIFGLGDAAKKVGGNTPHDIYDYLLKRFMFGEGAGSDLPGITNLKRAKRWIGTSQRFSKNLGFQVPYLQFDEDTLATALKRLEILGYTEAWVDEIGNVVYRKPGWDRDPRYLLPTGGAKNLDFARNDADAYTYTEVIPAGDPGIDSATAQALRAGRAPVPSSYLGAAQEDSSWEVSDSFVIDTNSKGKVTEKGKRNHWYRVQQRLGVRPLQISSPLIATQAQAQAQAEGLLRFYARTTKTVRGTIPGCPELRLGETIRIYGRTDEGEIDRIYYVEQVSHDYVEDQGYSTSFTGTHGRDPWDPHWRSLTLPRFNPADLAAGASGTLDDFDNTSSDTSSEPGSGGAGGKRPSYLSNLDERVAAAGLRQVRAGETYPNSYGRFEIPARYARDLVWVSGYPVPKWIAVELAWAKRHGWDGKITSAFRTNAHQRAINASGQFSAAAGQSNHEAAVWPRGAIDVANPGQLQRVLRGFPGGSALIGNGAVLGSVDPVHFSNTGR